MIIKGIYQVERCVGETPFGTIHNGTNLKTKAKVSLRLYSQNIPLKKLAGTLSDLLLKLSTLQHPNIVQVIDRHYEPEQGLWLIYDTPYEGSLADFTEKINALPLDSAQNIVMSLGKSLEYAHQKGIIHGGLSLQNIWIMKDGQVKAVNFAIDHLVNFYMLKNNILLLPTTFMPPEQLKTITISRTTDTFSLGALLYKLISGENPFPEIKDKQMHLYNLHKPPKPITLIADIPKYIEDILTKALHTDSRLRYLSVAELLGDLRTKTITISVAEAMKKIEKSATIAFPARAKQREATKKTMTNNSPQKKQTTKTTPSSVNTNKKNDHLADEPKMDYKKLLRGVVLAAAFGGVIIAVVQALFVGYFTSVPTLRVPNITSIPVAEGRAVLAQAGLRSKLAAYTSSLTITKNHIIETVPASGREVKKNRIIKLVVSKGVEKNKTPQLTGKSLKQAEAVLTEQNLALAITGYIYDLHIPANTIVAQSPKAGAVIDSGNTVNITISKGFPVSLSLLEDNFVSKKIMVSLKVPTNWEDHHIEIRLSDSRGLRTIVKTTLRAEEELIKDFTLEGNAYLEIYANSELVMKQSIAELKAP